MSAKNNTATNKENIEKLAGLLIQLIIPASVFILKPSDSAQENLAVAFVTFVLTGIMLYLVSRGGKSLVGFKPPNEKKHAIDVHKFVERLQKGWMDDQIGLIPSRINAYQQTLLRRSDLVDYKSLRGLAGEQDNPQTISEAFNENNQQLLIVGGAGSGKTLAMLLHTRKIINQRIEEEIPVLPLYLSLSSWDGSSDSFDQWVATEMFRLYKVDEAKADFWLRNPEGWHYTLLILDDLNEVPDAYSIGCIEAINTFIEQDQNVELMIACRTEDYEKIGTKLKIPGAVEIMPLDEAQTQDFITQTLADQNKVEATVNNYSSWNERTKSLRMLSIMVKVYNDKTNKIEYIKNVDDLLEKYLENQLRELEYDIASERLSNINWQITEIEQYLKKLAGKMQQSKLTELWVEYIQPEWLSKASKRPYEVLVYVICFMSIFIPCFISTGLVFGAGRPAVWFLGAPALATAMSGVVLLSREAHIKVRLRTILMGVLLYLGIISMVIIVISFEIGLIASVPLALLIFGLVFYMLKIDIGNSQTVYEARNDVIDPVEQLGRSFVMSLTGLVGASIALLVVAFLLLVFEVNMPSVFIFLAPTLIPMGLAGGLHGQRVSEDLRVRVNFGIRQSRVNAIRVTVVFGLIAGFVGGVLMGMENDLLTGITFGIVHGIFIGMTQAVLWGGFAFVQHYALRWYLKREETLPFKIEHFLSIASRSTLMLRIGGKYEFYPPEIKDYLVKSEA